jgi:hypothetical protein
MERTMLIRLALPLALTVWIPTVAAARTVRTAERRGGVSRHVTKWTAGKATFVHSHQKGPGSLNNWSRFSTRLEPGGDVYGQGASADGSSWVGHYFKKGKNEYAATIEFDAAGNFASADMRKIKPTGMVSRESKADGTRVITKSWEAKSTTFAIETTQQPDGSKSQRRYGYKTGPGAKLPRFLRK